MKQANLTIKEFSICEDLIYNSSIGKIQTPNSLALAISVRQISGCSGLISILNGLGHCVSLSMAYDTAMAYISAMAYDTALATFEQLKCWHYKRNAKKISSQNMELTISIYCDIVFVFEKFFIIYYTHQGEVECIFFCKAIVSAEIRPLAAIILASSPQYSQPLQLLQNSMVCTLCCNEKDRQ